jgi:hypothetical protein
MSTALTPPAGPPQTGGLSTGASEWLQEHLDLVRNKVVTEAEERAKRDNRSAVEPRDIAEAVKVFAPGENITADTSTGRMSYPASILERVLSWTPSITTVSAVLAIVFGIIGWKSQSASAFDIAKIFAGAVVGASGAAAVKRVKD